MINDLDRIELFGLEFNSYQSVNDAVGALLDVVPDGKIPVVITPNLDQIVNFASDPELKSFFMNSFQILPDGMPIVWSSRLLNTPIERRISGSDLFPLFWKKIITDKRKVLFVAANERMCRELKKEYSSANFYIPPMFELGSENYQSVLDNLNEIISKTVPEFIIVGISYPKREVLCRDLIEKYGHMDSKYLLIGAAPEFYAGIKKRAPKWMQDYGLEWFHRLLSEPARLFKRYLITSLKFLPILIKEIRNK